MKKLFILLAFVPVFCSAAWFGNGVPDYAQDAGSEFYCANAAGTSVTTAAGLSSSVTPLSIYNPQNSGKNLTILDVGIDVTASPAAAAQFMLAFNVTPSSGVGLGTIATVTPALIGKSTGTALGQCYRAGTLPGVPVAFRYLGGTTGASGIGGVVLTDQTNGKVVIPPGGLVSIQSTSAAAVLTHFLWREDPQ